MNEFNFTITKHQKKHFDDISKDFLVIKQINSSINGFEIKLSA